MENSKLCSKCKRLKPLAEFYKCKKGRYGRRGSCKKCDLKRTQSYIEQHSEQEKARHRRYYYANREKISEKSRRYRQTPQGKLAKKIRDHRYYARKMNCKINDLTTDQVRLLLKKTTHCAICLKRFKKNEGRALDHIVPLSKGGNNTLLNLQIAHLSCNSRKGNRHYANYGDGQLLLVPVFQESPFRRPEPIVLTEKKCSRCKIIKPIDSFHKNKATRNGHCSTCKQCTKISGAMSRKKRKEYLAQHPEEHLKVLERQRQWRKERVKQDPDYYKKLYYHNVEGSRRKAREHRERHKEYYQEYARGYSGKYYKKNKLKLRKRSREYHLEHKEQQNECTREWRRRHPDYYRDYRRSRKEILSLVS